MCETLSKHRGKVASRESVAAFTSVGAAVESEKDTVREHLVPMLPTPACCCAGCLPGQLTMFEELVGPFSQFSH